MMYLIDSDWAIDHLAERPDAQRLLLRLAEDRLHISIVSYVEIYQGVVQQPDQTASMAKFERFLAAAPVIVFSVPEGRRCAELRSALQQQGRRIRQRALDLMIAATAIEHDLILVTRNTRDYADIPGLAIYRQDPDD